MTDPFRTDPGLEVSQTSTADPAAVDLEAIQERRKPTTEYHGDLTYYHGDLTYSDVDDLIAAVEALQERVANFGGVESIRFIPRGVEVNGKEFVPANELENCQEARERAVRAHTKAWTGAEAAEARVVELAGALKWFDLHADSLSADLRSAHHSRGEGGSQWMVDDDRELRADFREAIEHARTALARLDARGKEE